MRPRRILFSALCALSIYASAQQLNPLTQAMLDGYATLLEQNPNDYLTLYERASQYYRLDDYDKALSDIKRAIACTPAKEKEQLSSAYSLLTDIYTQMGMYQDALSAVDQALTYTPSSYPLLYMKGNTCLQLHQPEKAEAAFTAMQRINPRSSEAIFGLARVAVLQRNNDTAIKLLSDAEKLAPGNYLTYCRLGDIHKEMDMPQQAAADYLSAFSLTSESDRPIRSLMDLAKHNYDAVDEAIDYALAKTSNVVPLYFIQGNAALEAGRYNDAYTAYRQLMASLPEGEMKGLYSSMAEICLHNGDIAEADNYASKAIMSTSNERNNILKASIEAARGNYAAAMMYAKAALTQNPLSDDALMLSAEAAYNMQDFDAAISYLNEAIMNDAHNADALLFRGYINAEKHGNKAAALNDYNRVSNIPADTPARLTRKAIGQIKAGYELDAAATIAPVMQLSGSDAKAAYCMSLYNIAANNIKEAKEYLEKARNAGFDDQYLLQFYAIPLLSIAPIR